MSQTDWLIVIVGSVLFWGLVFLSWQVESLRDRLAPEPDDDDEDAADQ
jgi:hypothetical protein